MYTPINLKSFKVGNWIFRTELTNLNILNQNETSRSNNSIEEIITIGT